MPELRIVEIEYTDEQGNPALRHVVQWYNEATGKFENVPYVAFVNLGDSEKQYILENDDG